MENTKRMGKSATGKRLLMRFTIEKKLMREISNENRIFGMNEFCTKPPYQ